MNRAILCLLCFLPVVARATMVINCVQETTAAGVAANLKDWQTSELIPGIEVRSQREARARAQRAFREGLDQLVVPGDCITVVSDPVIFKKYRSTELKLCVLVRGKTFGRNCPDYGQDVLEYL